MMPKHLALKYKKFKLIKFDKIEKLLFSIRSAIKKLNLDKIKIHKYESKNSYLLGGATHNDTYIVLDVVVPITCLHIHCPSHLLKVYLIKK